MQFNLETQVKRSTMRNTLITLEIPGKNNID